MQLEVIRGPAASGKTTQLRRIAKADGQDEGHILLAKEFTHAALKSRIHFLAARGARVVCIDECSEEQIELLRRLSAALPNIHIHAAVAA
ncbi:hypothetical protein PSCT_01869 [Pseudomonas sp. SCT]|uniref:hypothetical protein n=1 Tax=Pseudomonas sp. (strain SCT) TaxID=412955 RepID=UPI000ED4D2F0|nr:hypothetical protein [Pseudomonas sp. SCT]GCA55676.1 hypothetical protein PSCT_01869 [Pseudomonas sp. SCT]